jgi:hypothetical protein
MIQYKKLLPHTSVSVTITFVNLQLHINKSKAKSFIYHLSAADQENYDDEASSTVVHVKKLEAEVGS